MCSKQIAFKRNVDAPTPMVCAAIKIDKWDAKGTQNQTTAQKFG